MDRANQLKEFWKEADTEDQLVFSLLSRVTDALIIVTDSSGKEAGLFWSDGLRAELWNSDPDCVIVSTPVEVWHQQILPAMGYDNALVGLNWDEDTEFWKPEEVIQGRYI